MTVKELNEWLVDVDETREIELMIETPDGRQFQFPMTDMATSSKLVIMIAEPGELFGKAET